MADFEVKYTKLFINNEWVDAKDKRELSVINPSTEKEICKVALAGKADVDAAVQAAKDAFKCGSEWRKMNASKRGHLLYKIAGLIERDAEIIAKLETSDIGIPINLSRLSSRLCVEKMRYFAGWADKNHGKVVPIDDNFFAYTRHEPIGVCGGIIPWNLPLITFCSKVAPCLCMGNTMVLKPSEITPLTSLHFASLAKEAGIPPGVLNIVTGTGPEAGSAMSHHMDIDKISFTGSLAVGKLVLKAAADSNLKKVTLELGGKSPMIVFSDMNVDQAVATAHAGIMLNSGQLCCATSRVYVQEEIYDQFVEKSVAMAMKRKPGDPFVTTNTHGPLANQKQLDSVLGFLERGKDEGAKIQCGGNRVKGMKGYFVEPTVMTDIKDNAEMTRDEVFGPIQQIYKFKEVEEVLERANDTYFGLAAAVVTNDINKYLTIANQLKAGVVWVNCVNHVDKAMPFGGYQQSGIGRENGEYGLQEYTQVKSIVVKQPESAKC